MKETCENFRSFVFKDIIIAALVLFFLLILLSYLTICIVMTNMITDARDLC